MEEPTSETAIYGVFALLLLVGMASAVVSNVFNNSPIRVQSIGTNANTIGEDIPGTSPQDYFREDLCRASCDAQRDQCEDEAYYNLCVDNFYNTAEGQSCIAQYDYEYCDYIADSSCASAPFGVPRMQVDSICYPPWFYCRQACGNYGLVD